jgi:hypothetical protein
LRHTTSEILECAILFQKAGEWVEREASATKCDDRLRGDHDCDFEEEQLGTFMSLLSELEEVVSSFFAQMRVDTLIYV